MREQKPFHIRKIDPSVDLSGVSLREYEMGSQWMAKKVEKLNEYISPYSDYEIGFGWENKSQREVHYFLEIREK